MPADDVLPWKLLLSKLRRSDDSRVSYAEVMAAGAEPVLCVRERVLEYGKDDDYEPPGGELFDDFCARTWAAMERAVALGPNTLIVAHGGLWISARRRVAVDPDLPRMPNALPLHVEPNGKVWRHRIIGSRQWTDALTV